MLVLTRKIGEAVAIGDDIKIIVMQVKGKQVRLGIKAGTQTTVHREEVYQRIVEENKAAASSVGELPRGDASQMIRQQVETPSGTKVWFRKRVKPADDAEGSE